MIIKNMLFLHIKSWEQFALQRKIACTRITYSNNSKIILNSLLKKKDIHLNSRKIKKNVAQNEKLSVVKRIFDKNRTSFSIVKSISAASVIKRLNWENEQLYGPIISSRKATKSECEANETINFKLSQKEIETKPNLEMPDHNNKEIFTSIENDKEILSSILDFPLLNKSESNNLNFNKYVNNFGNMTKYLENLASSNSVPSVSTILQSTMPLERVEILNRWKMNMIKELGEEGFEKYRQELFANGSLFHNCISTYLSMQSEREIIIEPSIAGYWKSLKTVFPNISDIKLLEEHVCHPYLKYRGVVDCFANYKGHLVVIDWKTSSKPKPTLSKTYDNPLQIAAYIGALNFDPKYCYIVQEGLLVIAYEDGRPAQVHNFNKELLNDYWKQWLKRLKLYWEAIENPLS